MTRLPSSAVRLNVAVATAYAATGWLGLQVPYYGPHVTLVWVPTAIALAAIVLAGPRVIPGVFLGSVALNVSQAPSFPGGSALIALGNTLGPSLSGIALARRYGFRPQLDRVRDAVAYLGVGVLGTGVITASLGALWFCLFGLAPWRDYGALWLTWFGGEAAGSLIVGPLLLTWLSRPDPNVSAPARWPERVAMVLSAAFITAIVLAFGAKLVSLPFACAFLFGWILLRAGLRGAYLALVLVGFTLVVGTAIGAGPFAGQGLHSGMLSLWIFLAAMGSAILIGGGLIGERDRALHHQRRLLAELDHRVKNTLATVVALAERSRDDAVDLDDFRRRFLGRVRAIARTHEGLARSNWEAMDVAQIVALTLAPFAGGGSDQLSINGDGTTLAASKVAPLTMVLHELATNAAKHGAWSRNGGKVTVAWARNGDGTLRLRWREAGGPTPAPTPEPGYGLRLIEGTVGHQLGGRADLAFTAQGLVCTLDIPTASSAGGADPA